MKTLAKLFLLGVLFAQIPVVNAQVRYTNQTTDMRNGPAAYYELILRLYINNQVYLDSTHGYWGFIHFQDKKGWVPSYTLSAQKVGSETMKSDSLQKRMSLMFSQLNNTGNANPDEMVASAAQVSAAVKGFAEKYRKARGIEITVDLERYRLPAPSPAEYQAFIGVRNRGLTNLQRRKYLYPEATFIPFTDPAIDQIGYAVASVVAQDGLVSNYALQRYLDLLTALIVENSHRPEIDVKVFVLDTDEVQGYALPGNFVFISKGAIKQMNNEAELVHFLSHEIAHIVFSHGMLEYRERDEKIRAENAFDELRAKVDAQSPDADLRTMEQGLTDWAHEVYDYIHKDRLEAYEIDADKWAGVYTYLSGYNPAEAVKYLQRIQISETEARMEWNGLALENRVKAINRGISHLEKTGNVNNDLFERLKNAID